jgi:microcystin-dependent protein
MIRKLAALALVVAAPVQAAVVATGSAGGNVAFSNYQPSLVVNQRIQTQGIFPCRDCAGGGAAIGMVRSFGFNYGVDMAQGQLLSIAQNTALFSILGTTYGGNGQTTFALPDLAGTLAIGAGNAPGLGSYVLGGEYGSAMTALTVANLPSHAHGLPGGGTTTAVGGNQAFDNMQPSLGLNYLIQTQGIFPSRNDAGLGDGESDPFFVEGGYSFIGQIGLFAGNFEPGWMIADGRLLAISEYSALFSIIGTTYGGDGQTTFALPDLRGRVAVGSGQGPGLGNVALGQQFGGPTHTLTTNQMPAHDHDLEGGGTTDAAGGSQPFSQHQASLGINFAVALQGLFPSRDQPLNYDGTYLGEIIAFAGDFAPRGYALANGQLLSIAQNQALFSLFGTQFGGNGQTTFALPDLRGRAMMGSGGTFFVGQQYGSATTTLTEANLPAHVHFYEADAAVPEPATWFMLILGFGLAGGVMRRRAGLARVFA